MFKFFITFLLVLGLIACSEKPKNNIIKFGISADYPPFEYNDHGEFKGFDIDLAKLVAKDLGKEIEFVDMEFKSLFPALNNGQVDIVIATMTKTEDRMKYFDFSAPYYHEKMTLIFLKDHIITNINDLEQKKIAAQLGSVMEIWLKANMKNSEIIAIDNTNQMIESLKAGHIDGVLLDAVQARIFCSKNPTLLSIDIAETQDGYAMLFKKDSAYKDEVNKIIAKLEQNGELANLKNKWTYEWKQ